MENRIDEVLVNICAEKQGRLEIDPDAIEPRGNCFYSKLILAGFPSDILRSADDSDGQSINFLHNLVYPEHLASGGRPLDKMRPQCLSLVIIIQKCKLKVATSVSENIVSKEEKALLAFLLYIGKSKHPNVYRTNNSRALTSQTAISGNVSMTKLRENL